jgi:hypothetical protein
MAKFKVGDRVESLIDSGDRYPKGATGVITQGPYSGSIYMVKWDAPVLGAALDNLADASEANLKLEEVKFKVGDSVRVKSNADTSTRGRELRGQAGVVTKIGNGLYGQYCKLDIEPGPVGGIWFHELEPVQPEEVGNMKTRFKVGDKVRRVNKVLTGVVTEISPSGKMRIQNDRTGGMLVGYNLSGWEPVDEFQELLDKANEGVKAMNKLNREHKGKVVFFPEGAGSATSLERIMNSSVPAFFNDGIDVFKHDLTPKLEPFTVGAAAWGVELRGGKLHIGCKSFEVKPLLQCLREFSSETISSFKFVTPSSPCVVTARRNGLSFSFNGSFLDRPTNETHKLTWAEVDQIIKALEKAGVK